MSPKPRNRASMDAEAVAQIMAAQEEANAASSPVEPPTMEASPALARNLGFDPGKVDGRTLRRTGREPFATRIKPETHEALRRIAYHRQITIAEALEMAVAAFERG